jgi:hypothetical protein
VCHSCTSPDTASFLPEQSFRATTDSVSVQRKASIFNDQAQVDECASLGGDQKGQRLVLLSHGNRLLTSTQYAAQLIQDHHQNVNRYQICPEVPPPDADKVFLMYPNMLGMMNMRGFHPDTAALDLVPSAGWFDQYFPKSIDAKVASDTPPRLSRRRMANSINNLVVRSDYNPRAEH